MQRPGQRPVCFCKFGALFPGILLIRAVLVGICTMAPDSLETCTWFGAATVEASKLEHDRSATTNNKKKESQQGSSYIHVPSFWNLPYNREA